VGGIPAVMKYLLQKGFLDGSCMTVTGEVPAALHASLHNAVPAT
jgi:dihydroxy-acid dehydratase